MLDICNCYLFFNGFFLYSDENVCNTTITIDSTSPLGSLHFAHNDRDNKTCNIVIETSKDHRIGFFFLETSAFQTIRIENDALFYSCKTWVQLPDGSHRLSSTRCVHSAFNNDIHSTNGNKLKIQVTRDDVTTFFFILLFYSFHEGSCGRHEQKCNHKYIMNTTTHAQQGVCINSRLICHDTYGICNSTVKDCPDFVADENGTFVSATAVTVFLTSLLVLAIGVFCIVNLKNRCCKLRNQETVTSEECDYDVDPSKFDPPPEYSTLEINDQCSTIKISGNNEPSMPVVPLPSYDDVMKNCRDYSVASHM